MSEFKDFYDTLIENLDGYEGEYAYFINCGPNLFNLLCDLLSQKEISREMRLEISAAIAYYVAPDDIIPEEIYGPYGYIDDIFVSVYVLRKVAKEFGYEFLQDLWKHETDVKEVMDDCYDNSLELLEDKVHAVLSYVGLMD
ncbi:YkvA family protein [Methanobrevibacter sp.]|uniref:YkvA family protein n=1 Tax=Methanobrevibacter sp. TaxID=66852 RepID=UPI00386D914F